jgi:hypothetical protein
VGQLVASFGIAVGCVPIMLTVRAGRRDTSRAEPPQSLKMQRSCARQDWGFNNQFGGTEQDSLYAPLILATKIRIEI